MKKDKAITVLLAVVFTIGVIAIFMWLIIPTAHFIYDLTQLPERVEWLEIKTDSRIECLEQNLVLDGYGSCRKLLIPVVTRE